jgi:hypothetical protein
VTGETLPVAQIDGWGAGRGLQIRRINDPYSAAAELSRPQREEPAMIWIGTDWLSMNEYCLVSCIRQRWSRVPIVLYGAYADEIDEALAPPLWRVVSDERIEQFLKSPPAELELLLQRSIVEHSAGSAPGISSRASETRFIALVREDGPEAGLHPDATAPDSDDDPPGSLRGARAALSPRELATLLGEQEPRGA